MWECEICEGQVASMGILGNLHYGRCINCGHDQSVDADVLGGDVEYEEEPCLSDI